MTASAQAYSLEALVATWSPVVESERALVGAKISTSEFSARLSDDSLLDEVAKHVAAMLYSVKASNQVSDFVKMVSDS
jgi:hypothetical protein